MLKWLSSVLYQILKCHRLEWCPAADTYLDLAVKNKKAGIEKHAAKC